MRLLPCLVLAVGCGSSKPATPARCADLAACAKACEPCRAGACDSAAGRACRELGKLHLRGAPPQFDLAAAAEVYRTACDGGDAASCASLGLQVQDGRGVAWDVKRAVEVYTRACDGGAGVGCFNLGLMYHEGNGAAVDDVKAHALMERAEKLYQPACEADPSWCSNIGFLYENGMLGAPDFAKAAEVYRKACERDDPDSCVSLSLLELDGRGVPANRDAALARLETTCNAGGALACGALGRSLDPTMENPPPRALTLLERSCDGGIAQSCGALSAMYALGRVGPADLAKAGKLGIRACDLGSSIACMAHAQEVLATNPKEAGEFFVRACHIGQADGCMVAATMIARRELAGTPDDVRPLLEQACRLGNHDACSLARSAH